MDQVRSNRNLHVMVIVKVVPVVINPPEGEAVCKSFLAGLAPSKGKFQNHKALTLARGVGHLWI